MIALVVAVFQTSADSAATVASAALLDCQLEDLDPTPCWAVIDRQLLGRAAQLWRKEALPEQNDRALVC